jgi:hypothetical protein
MSLSGTGVESQVKGATLLSGKYIIYKFKPGGNGHITAAFTLPDGTVSIACFGKDSVFPRTNLKLILKMRVPETPSGNGSLDIIMSEEPIIQSKFEADEIDSISKFIDKIASSLNRLASDYWDIEHISVKYERSN